MKSIFKSLVKSKQEIEIMPNIFQSLSPEATAKIKGNENFENIDGMVYFFNYLNGTLIVYNIDNLPFSNAECASNFLGTTINENAIERKHFSKNNCPHPAHTGDLPNLYSSNGKGLSINYIDKFKVNEIIDKFVILYLYPDNYSISFEELDNPIIATGKIIKF